jgi:hypothetical protein
MGMAKKKASGMSGPKETQEWSKKSIAHTQTWLYLVAWEDEFEADFAIAKDVRVDHFRHYWNQNSSPAMKRQEALAYAGKIDEHFRGRLRATFEPGFNFGSGMEALADLLEVGSTTVGALAVKIDEVYDI